MPQTTLPADTPRVAVVGAGAVGSFFGAMLARAGARVTLVGRPGPRSAGLEAIARDGLQFKGIHFQERIPIEVSSDPSSVRDAEIILFAVKTIDTESAARGIAPHLRPDAVVLSLQNGVENEEQIRAALAPAAARVCVVPTVVFVAAAVPAPGHLIHGGRGDLVIGPGRVAPPPGTLERTAAIFESAAVPCRISQNIVGDLWFKLVWNCAGNAISALGRCSYGLIGRVEPANELMVQAAREVIAVAHAAGVQLPDVDAVTAGMKAARSFGAATSSTSQDVERGRPTEIDSLNGFIARRGAELGVPTPVNRALWALVKLLDASNAERRKESAAAG
jgi:2-dehydropantoate 2-reductase